MSTWADVIKIDGHEVSVKVNPEEPAKGRVLIGWHGKVENASPEVQQLIAEALTGKAGPRIFSTQIGQIFFIDSSTFKFAGSPNLPDEVSP